MDEAVPQPDTSTPVVPDAAQIASVQEWTAQRDRFVEASLPQGDGDDGTASPAPADAAPAETPETADPSETRDRDDQGRFKKRDGPQNPQQRYDRLVAEREQARREAVARDEENRQLRARLDALARQAAPATPPAPTAQAPDAGAADPEPQEANYTDYAAFVRDQARWAARQEYRAQSQVAQQQVAAQRAQQDAQQAVTAFADRMKDVDVADLSPAVLNLRPSLFLQPGEPMGAEHALADVLLRHPEAPALLHHLSSHPDDLTALLQTRGRDELYYRIGRLESRLPTASSGPVVQTPPVSQAKPPIRPVGSGAGTPARSRDPKDISSVAEWNAYKATLTDAAR